MATNAPSIESSSDCNSAAIVDKKEPSTEKKKTSKPLVVFLFQSTVLLIIILTCLINLSIGQGDKDSLWMSLLSVAFGVMVPAPTYKVLAANNATKRAQSSEEAFDVMDGPLPFVNRRRK